MKYAEDPTFLLDYRHKLYTLNTLTPIFARGFTARRFERIL